MKVLPANTAHSGASVCVSALSNLINDLILSNVNELILFIQPPCSHRWLLFFLFFAATTEVAQIAGINAAKQTHSLIPLCHQLLLRKVSVDLALDHASHAVNITATAKTEGQTVGGGGFPPSLPFPSLFIFFSCCVLYDATTAMG